MTAQLQSRHAKAIQPKLASAAANSQRDYIYMYIFVVRVKIAFLHCPG